MENNRIGHDTISAPIRSVRRTRVVALIERDTDIKHDLPMAPRKWVVGSNPSCDIVLDDPYVSGLHCVLVRGPDESLIIKDCDSKNGSIVDNAPVICRELRPGALIRLGGKFLIAVGDPSGDSAIALLRGSDSRFRAQIALAIKAARSDCSVLVVGETGTGKDLIARLIHEASARCDGPFVPINCGAFPRELIGAELFGHVRGAFTGAVQDRDGVFVHADGGTLFLDELGELSLELQPNLLRVLETRRLRPIGGVGERSVDVRFVAATNRIDGLATPESPIRFDLYQRLAAVTITMLPLRERCGDIPELAQVFLDEFAYQYGSRTLKPAAFEALVGYDWPGNVRELRQTMLRAVALTDEVIDAPDLGLPTTRTWGATTLRQGPPRTLRLPAPPSKPQLAGHEKVLREVMASTLNQLGSVRAAARELGMPKSTFSDKARRYGLCVERRRRSDDDE